MKLELSIEKTRVSDLTEGFQFLGQRVRYKWHPRFGYMPRIEIPTSKRADLRYMVKQMTSGARGCYTATCPVGLKEPNSP
jgi:RNA-directed DNA polymerase